MYMANLNQFIQLIPKGAIWAQQKEQEILQVGIPLSESQLLDAKLIPIMKPEKVRILKVSAIPLPDDPEVKFAAQAIKLITPHTPGLSVRYGIFLRDDYWHNREIVVHELIHTAQYERLGGIQEFLNQYVAECIKYGFSAAPLEQEAINRTRLICT
jgi:hypothetical protein